MCFFLQTIAVTFPFSANDCKICVAGLSCFCCVDVLVVLGVFCFVGGILFRCVDVLVVLLSLIVMQSYKFFLNYLLRFPTARNFMFYVKIENVLGTSSEIAYLCIFRLFFRAVLKWPNLRFESAHLTSSFGLFDELIKALWQPQRGSLTKPPLF